MRLAAKCLSVILLWALSACAVADVAKTSVPPLTLGPAPTIVTKGSCEGTDDLENWAQAAYFQTTDFTRTFAAAIVKPRSTVYDDVLALQDMRTNMISRPTPECAFNAQVALAEAMDSAIRALQAYSNGDLKDISSQVSTLSARLANAASMQKALFDRVDQRYPTPQRTPAATSADAPVGG